MSNFDADTITNKSVLPLIAVGCSSVYRMAEYFLDIGSLMALPANALDELSHHERNRRMAMMTEFNIFLQLLNYFSSVEESNVEPVSKIGKQLVHVRRT